MKVFITPQFTHPDKGDGGIRRVVEAQTKYLPRYGWDVVSSMEEADVIACHGADFAIRKDRPMVAHCHGLYWDEYNWDGWAHDVNKQVVRVLAAAVAHTAPSNWVNTAMRRGMLIYPKTIYHGVESGEWQPQKDHGGYVLWNKARSDNVSNPEHLQRIAEFMPQKRFLSTIGIERNNLKITGPTNYAGMKDIVQNAGVYLATARETFGIGTLEALAAGVPVAGWDYGGQSEIIIKGETGYLAPFGDYTELSNCIEMCFKHRERMSRSCREDAVKRWGWEKRIKEYAEVYNEVSAWYHSTQYKVTVIVTCYNLAQYLPDALNSLKNQTMKNFECIIVDDCSKDNTEDVSKSFLDDKRFSYYKTPENFGLVGARNFGFSKSKGRYVIPLDADDMLTENALEILSSQLDLNPELHITSGHLDTISSDGSNRQRGDWPWKEFDWYQQMGHLNQMPYSTMVRREVIERSGGYRKRCWRAEDAENWCRVTSFGFRAKKVTEASTLIWRNTPNSKSKGEPGDGEWTSYFPWNLSKSLDEAKKNIQKIRGHEIQRPDLVPWGAQGEPPKGMLFWTVPHHFNPRISVITPVGPGHEKLVIDAVDSIMAQTMSDWEMIVINDTGKPWPEGMDSPLRGAPWAKIVSTGGIRGAGAARNLGAKCAKGEFLYFLDADDLALPTVLEHSLKVFEQNNSVVYTDWIKSKGRKEPAEYYETDDFVCGEVLNQMHHAMNVLVPKKWHEEIKGFDENMKGWEDWDYLIALQAAGRCSIRLAEPGFVYYVETGKRREASFDSHDELVQYVYKKWLPYYQGGKTLMCGCGSNSGRAASVSTPSKQGVVVNAGPDDVVMIQYNQPASSRMTIVGPVTRTLYNFETGEQKYVNGSDAQPLLDRSTKGISHFSLVDAPVQSAEFKMEVQEVKKPEFPTMPIPASKEKQVVPDISRMTAVEITSLVSGKSVDYIREMLRLEKEGKERKGVILLLTKAMTDAY